MLPVRAGEDKLKAGGRKVDVTARAPFLTLQLLVLLATACSGSQSGPTSATIESRQCVNTTGDPHASSPPRCVIFAGYQWVVKSSPRFDPGPNQWSDTPDQAFVDGQG